MENGEYAQFLKTLGGLATLVIVSMILERILAVIFEHDWFRNAFSKQVADPADPSRKIWTSKVPGFRETIAIVAALSIAHIYSFDILAMLFMKQADGFGITLTGLVIAGGSAGAIALFQGFLGMGRDAREAATAAKRVQSAASVAGAQAELEARRTQIALAIRERNENTLDTSRPPGGSRQ